MTRTMVEGEATPAPGTPLWASMMAVEMGVPSRNPNSVAAPLDKPPALVLGEVGWGDGTAGGGGGGVFETPPPVVGGGLGLPGVFVRQKKAAARRGPAPE